MAKEVNIHIKAPGARQTKKEVDGVAKSVKNAGDKAGQAGKGGLNGLSDSTNKNVSGFRKITGSIGTFIAKIGLAMAAVKLLTGILRANREELESNAAAAEKHQRSVLRLQFLGGFFRERPELFKEVSALAEYGRRDFPEVADAWYNLRSKGGALTQQQKDSIMKEALEMGRTDPDAPLPMLVDMFSLYAKKTGQTDANRIQNVLQQTIKEAGGSTADVAKYMTQFLSTGMTGGLSGTQTAGLWAWATGQTADVSKATTGLESLFSGLQGKGSPESLKMLKQMGIDKDMDFFSKINILSPVFAAGDFSLGQAQLLAERVGAPILIDLLKNPQAAAQITRNIAGVDRGDIDLTKSMITELMGTDELAMLEEENRLIKIETANLRARDIKALRVKHFEQLLEKDMLEQSQEPDAGFMDSPFIRALRLRRIKTRHSFGLGDDYNFSPDIFMHNQPGRVEPGTGPVIVNNHYGDNYQPLVAPDDVGGPRSDDTDLIQ